MVSSGESGRWPGLLGRLRLYFIGIGIGLGLLMLYQAAKKREARAREAAAAQVVPPGQSVFPALPQVERGR